VAGRGQRGEEEEERMRGATAGCLAGRGKEELFHSSREEA